jgi:hypothetical protein
MVPNGADESDGKLGFLRVVEFVIQLGSGVKAGEEIFERFGRKTERNSTLRGLGREQAQIQDIG